MFIILVYFINKPARVLVPNIVYTLSYVGEEQEEGKSGRGKRGWGMITIMVNFYVKLPVYICKIATVISITFLSYIIYSYQIYILYIYIIIFFLGGGGEFHVVLAHLTKIYCCFLIALIFRHSPP